MRLFDDTIMFEFCEEEWKLEGSKSRIITPDSVKAKHDGEFSERVPIHFFRVVEIGPKCKKVQVGDRVIPKPADLTIQPKMQPAVIWIDGVKVVRYFMPEKCVAGVE